MVAAAAAAGKNNHSCKDNPPNEKGSLV